MTDLPAIPDDRCPTCGQPIPADTDIAELQAVRTQVIDRLAIIDRLLNIIGIDPALACQCGYPTRTLSMAHHRHHQRWEQR